MEYLNKKQTEKYFDIYGQICNLRCELSYKGQKELIFRLKESLDMLEIMIDSDAKILRQGRKELTRTIHLDSSVIVSDPCYSVGTWCTGKIDNMLVGDYTCYKTMKHTSWGLRVSELAIVHSSYCIDDLEYTEVEGVDIGTDSGQCGIYDTKYYESKHIPDLDETWYSKVCNLTNHYDAGVVDKLGVVSESGFGDGSYTLYESKNTDGKTISLKVIYINDVEEEENDD